MEMMNCQKLKFNLCEIVNAKKLTTYDFVISVHDYKMNDQSIFLHSSLERVIEERS